MARLIIVFDAQPKPTIKMGYLPATIKHASMDVADDIEATDIYAIARKLAEILLEQLR